MKNLILGLGLLLSTAATVAGCRETSKLPEPAIENLPLIIPVASTDPNKRFYSLQRARQNANGLLSQDPATRPTFEFTINPTSRDVKVRTVEVYKSFAIPLNAAGTAFNFGPRVKLGDYSNFPVTISVGSMEALKGLAYLDAGLPIPVVPLGPDGNYDPAQFIIPVTLGRAVVFTFEYVLEDGRRIVLTPLDTRGGITGTFTSAPYAIYALFQNPD